MSFTFIDTTESLTSLLNTIGAQSHQSPSLYIDLEGVKLSRHGTIAIFQLLILPISYVYIIDIYVLQKQAFETPSSAGLTLKAILESDSIPKVFFDVRRDSDALFAHFQINLRCIQDIQVLEFATRKIPGRYLNGLAKCIEYDGGVGLAELASWRSAKKKGCQLIAPEQGGSYDVFLERPLSTAIMEYCVQDVTFLPNLYNTYSTRLAPEWSTKVRDECLARVKLSQSASFVSDGSHMVVGPVVVPEVYYRPRPDTTEARCEKAVGKPDLKHPLWLLP